MPSSVFAALPGYEIPTNAIAASLDAMWTRLASEGKPSPAHDNAKATQVNLVLHLGFGTTPDDGLHQFQTAVRFSRRHPSRVVVLCPMPLDDTTTGEIHAKINGECTIGKTTGDTRCCEFVMLTYPMSARRHLESQVSICLSTDLPLYYWVHRFKDATRLADYQHLFLNSQRVIFDSAVLPESFKTHPWPRPETMRDLACARLLPVRQTIGQFLSACPPAALIENLAAIRVAHDPAHAAEAAALLAWARDRLAACGLREPIPATIKVARTSLSAPPDAPPDARTGMPMPPPAAAPALSLDFDYNAAATPNRFHWHCLIDPKTSAGISRIDASLCHGPIKMDTPLAFPAPESALAEAMFF